MREDHVRRDWQSLLVGSAVVVLSVGYFVGVEVHNLVSGLVAGLAFVAVSASLAVINRQRTERRVATVVAGSLAVNAVVLIQSVACRSVRSADTTPPTNTVTAITLYRRR